MDLDAVMKNVYDMRLYLEGPHTLESVLSRYGEFKAQCPKLFELVLENKQGYMEELQNMVIYAKKVKSGDASLEDATKVVKHTYDKKYIYPVLKTDNLTHSQISESREYVANQQLEVEALEAKWERNSLKHQRDEPEI
jgi:hypothetical protein